MPHIGGHSLSHGSNPSGGYAGSIAAALCGAEVARGGKLHACCMRFGGGRQPPAFLIRGGMQREGETGKPLACGITFLLPRLAFRTESDSQEQFLYFNAHLVICTKRGRCLKIFLCGFFGRYVEAFKRLRPFSSDIKAIADSIC